MAICITEVCGGGILILPRFFTSFESSCSTLQDQQCQSCQTEVIFTQTDDLQQGVQFSYTSERIGVNSAPHEDWVVKVNEYA